MFKGFFQRVRELNQWINAYVQRSEGVPDPSLGFVNWGIELATEGDLQAAVKRFEKAASMAPNRSEAYTNWGVALAKAGQLELACEKFELAVEKAPEIPSNYVLWGAALIELEDDEAAEKQYKQAMELCPSQPEPHINWAIALSRKKRYSEAIDKLREALVLKPQHVQGFFLWGAILAEQEKYREAIEKFKEVVRLAPKHGEAYYFWSVALNRLGEYQNALAVSKKALAFLPDKPELYLNIGDSLANLDKLDVAMANYRHALSLNPQCDDAYFSMGKALQRLGKGDEAAKLFQKVLSLNDAHVGATCAWVKNQLTLPLDEAVETPLPSLGTALMNALPKASVADKEQLLCLLAGADWYQGKVLNGNEHLRTLASQTVNDVIQPSWMARAAYLSRMFGQVDLGQAFLSKALSHKQKPVFGQCLSAYLTLEPKEALEQLRPTLRQHQHLAMVQLLYALLQIENKDYSAAQTKLNTARQSLSQASKYDSLFECYLALEQGHINQADIIWQAQELLPSTYLTVRLETTLHLNLLVKQCQQFPASHSEQETLSTQWQALWDKATEQHYHSAYNLTLLAQRLEHLSPDTWREDYDSVKAKASNWATIESAVPTEQAFRLLWLEPLLFED